MTTPDTTKRPPATSVTPAGTTLLIGGARSGKSTLAIEIASTWRGPVDFVATAEARDDDMARRIERHRAERPTSWVTIEEPMALADAIGSARAEAVLIVDCLTMWVANLVLAGQDDETIGRTSAAAVELATRRQAPTVVVTNEVGLGIVPEHPLGRSYRDTLGRVNAQWAAAARRSLFLVAGRALRLHDPMTALHGDDDGR